MDGLSERSSQAVSREMRIVRRTVNYAIVLGQDRNYDKMRKDKPRSRRYSGGMKNGY